MKKILLFILLLPSLLNATTYYVSNSGSDGAAGTASGSSWQSIAKVNSSTSSGDIILFKRGDTFIGQLVCKANCTYDYYGSGVNPIISGATVLSSWTSDGGGIYHASLSTEPQVVTINNSQFAVGRYPNSGWLNMDAANSSQITSSGLSGQTGMSGAKVVVRMNRFIIEKLDVTGQSGTTININTPNYDPDPGWGFFITDKLSTLDQYGEWYYDGGTNRLYVYFGGSGTTNVTASNIDNVVLVHNVSGVTINHIDIMYANVSLIDVDDNSNNLTISNGSGRFSGNNGIFRTNSGGSNNFTVQNYNFYHIDNEGIVLYGSNNGVLIENCIFQFIAMIPGEGGVNDYDAIATETGNTINETIRYCRIDSVGYNGTYNIGGNNSVIEYNYITNYCQLLDDGGGIYLQRRTGTNKQVIHNICINYGHSAGGSANGADDNSNQTYGIYSDASNNNTEIAYNTESGNGLGGLYMDDSQDLDYHDNLCYDNEKEISLEFLGHDVGFGTEFVTGITVTNNIFISPSNSNTVARYADANVTSWGTIDYNKYSRPLNQGTVINYNDGSNHNYTVAQLVSNSPYEDHGGTGGWTIADPDELILVINPTNASAPVSITDNYVDINGTTYNGTITLGAYAGAVLKFVSSGSGSTPSNPGNPTSNSPQMTTVTITRSGSVPGGETWYWQGTSCGTSTSNGSGATYSATSTGTYYIRARDNTSGNWSSSCGSVSVTITGTPINSKFIYHRNVQVH